MCGGFTFRMLDTTRLSILPTALRPISVVLTALLNSLKLPSL